MNFRRCVAIALLLLTLPSCRRSSRVGSDTVVLGVAAAPLTMDPRYATDSIGQNLKGLLFSALVRVNPDPTDPDHFIQGDLAESWTYKNLVYTFQLRPGLRFNNGDLLTAEDILFSFKEFQKESCPFSAAFKKIKQVEARYDDQERWVKITVSHFESTFYLDLQAIQMLPRKILEAHDKDFYNHLVGTGAYRIESANENEIRLLAVAGHYRQPKVSKVIIKIVRDDNSRFQRLYNGSLDIIQADLPLSKLQVFKTSNRFDVFELPGSSVTYLLINLRDPLLKQLPVRQAMNYAINRDEIIKYKLEGYASPASTIAIPGTPYFDSSLQLPGFDLAKGQELIKNIPPKTPLELKTSNQKYAMENGRILAYQLEKLGFDISLKSFEWGTYYDDIKKGRFQLATMKFVGVLDPDHYRLAFHSSQLAPKGINRAFYTNPELDPLLEAGNKIESIPARIEAYKKIQRIVFNDLPIIPLWYDKYVAVVNKRIKNFKPSAFGGFSFLFAIEKTDDDKQK